jgi:hypothetical protein
MGHYYHKKHKRKLKHIERKILYLIVPLSFLLAFGIQIAVKGVPRWIYSIIANARIEEKIAGALIRGSYVRIETPLRRKYEEKYRENSEDQEALMEQGKTWRDNYQQILQNTNKDEVKEYEKLLKDEKRIK